MRGIERRANASNPPVLGAPLRLLAASARHGQVLLTVSIFAGVLCPPLAHLFRPVITPVVIALMTLILLRVDIPAAFALLRRPVRLAAVVVFQLLVCPVIAWAAVAPLGLDPGITDGVVIFATGCAATSSPAFARLVGLDPELSLLATLATTLLVPLTGPPTAAALLGLHLALGIGAFMARLGVVVGAPLLLSLALRRVLGPQRLEQVGPAVDGGVVWLLVAFAIGVMDGITARLLADPGWVAQALVAAFAAALGLNLLTTLAFAWMGRREAASAGLMSGNRNMALYLAALPSTADPRIGLFFALCQFPLFLSVLLRPAYRRLLAPAA